MRNAKKTCNPSAGCHGHWVPNDDPPAARQSGDDHVPQADPFAQVGDGRAAAERVRMRGELCDPCRPLRSATDRTWPG
jgi:hypothetical protein